MVMEAQAKMETRTVAAGEFKAKCLQLMDEVQAGGLTLVVTKRGKPVVQVSAPVAEPKPFRSIVGRSPGVRILGDILSPLDWGDPGERLQRAQGKRNKNKKS